MNKKVPFWIVLLLLWIFVITTVFFGWSVWYINNGGAFFGEKSKNIIVAIAKFPTSVKESIQQITSPTPLITKSRYPDINGLKFSVKNYADSNYLLFSAYNKPAGQCVVKLMRVSDQKIMHQWIPNMDEIKDKRDQNSKLLEGKVNDMYRYTIKQNISINYPLLLSDGSIIFNTEHGPVMKCDKNSKILWTLNGTFHHGIEPDAEGNLWASSIIAGSKFMSKNLKDYEDDALAKISPEGKLLYQKSVNEILIENGYRGLLFGVGPLEAGDPLHLNDIQPALTSTKYWEKSDVLVSLRNKSTVFLYRPSTNKIIWLKTGPWLYQHDADFIDESRIGVFGNNVIRNTSFDFIDGHNEQYVFDFKTNELTTPYSEFLKKAKVSTRIGGQSQVLSNGDLFVEESTFGRLLRGNGKDIIWQYVEHTDKESAALFFWSRIINGDEIKSYGFLNIK